MSLQFVVDMNLSPEWITEFGRHGLSAVHWSAIGDARASDAEIATWARGNKHVVFTHDLDFGTLLALSPATGPSVLQVRCENVMPQHIGPVVMTAIHCHRDALESGAIVVVDERRSRVRILPFS